MTKSVCLSRRLVAATLFLFLPHTAFAADVLYDCTFKQRGARDGGWIPERLVLTHNTEAGTVKVYDTIIDYFVGSPIKANVKTETPQRVSFRWNVTTKDAANQQVSMQYAMNYFKDGRPATMSAMPGGYDNNYTGSGSCKLGKP